MYTTTLTKGPQEEISKTAELCLQCAQSCEQCFAECICMEMSGMAACIALCRDCADICLLTAQYMSRFSKFHPQSSLLCAEVCVACAAECERMAASHSGRSKEILQRCADLCRRCAISCRRVAETGQAAA